MKNQKHYNTREEIIAEIDKVKELLASKTAQAEQMDADAARLFKTGDPYKCSQGRELKAASKKLKRSAFLLEEKKIPQLARTLAAFDTEVLKMEGNESRAVVLAEV